MEIEYIQDPLKCCSIKLENEKRCGPGLRALENYKKFQSRHVMKFWSAYIFFKNASSQYFRSLQCLLQESLIPAQSSILYVVIYRVSRPPKAENFKLNDLSASINKPLAKRLSRVAFFSKFCEYASFRVRERCWP